MEVCSETVGVASYPATSRNVDGPVLYVTPAGYSPEKVQGSMVKVEGIEGGCDEEPTEEGGVQKWVVENGILRQDKPSLCALTHTTSSPDNSVTVAETVKVEWVDSGTCAGKAEHHGTVPMGSVMSDAPESQNPESLEPASSQRTDPASDWAFKCNACNSIFPSHSTFNEHFHQCCALGAEVPEPPVPDIQARPCEPHSRGPVAAGKRSYRIQKGTRFTPGEQVILLPAKSKVGKALQLCRFKMPSSPSLQMNTQTQVNSSWQGAFTCYECMQIFDNFLSAAEHRCITNQRHMKGLMVYQCLECHRQFSGVTGLQQHVSGTGHHAMLLMPTNKLTRRRKCAMCGEKFVYDGCLRDHYNLHQVRLPLQCVTCGCMFPNYPAFHRHTACHPGPPKLKCLICGCFLTKLSEHNQGSHVANHFSLPHIRCDKCHPCEGRRVTNSSGRNLRPFRCSVCGQTFTNQYNMMVHMSYHTKAVAFPCSLCSRNFRFHNDLKAHTARHVEQINSEHSYVIKSLLSRKDVGKLWKELE